MIDCAVLIAVGIAPNGKRDVLGVSVSLSEAEVHWRDFLQSLVQRGLHGVKLLVSDAHEGLQAARKSVFPSLPWQRCQFHLQQNASHYVSRKELRKDIACALRAIFNAPDQTEALRLMKLTIERFAQNHPKLTNWIEENIPQGLTVFTLPEVHRLFLRTTNMLERTNREIKRRTQVASIFPNPEACLRLVSAILCETSEEWQAAQPYLRTKEIV